MTLHGRTDGEEARPEGRSGRDAEPPDRVVDAVAAERRRVLLSYLDGKRGEVASLVELVDHVAGREADAEVERVAFALRYVHLPRLEADGLVEYDRRSGAVRYRGPTAPSGVSAGGT